MADTVQRVKEKLSIADVVSPYVKLARAGKYLKGLSPFNKEKTPSFFVNVERGSYYCFSSGQGGDMFTFIEKMEGVDFKGALKILAEKAGVPLEYERGAGKESREKADRLREATARAELFFKSGLTEGSSAYAYARSRGLNPETIAGWDLGFAPDAWRGLLDELTKAGFALEELAAAGLVKEAEGKPGTYYDRFRNRLMFPIRDAAGRALAFTGRALDPKEEAKYLNSPETELFKKSHVLFAMDRAKDEIRRRGYALLMEGQMDVLHAHQAGFANAVALSGTALSETHVALLKRYSDNLMLALDADRAGLAATHKHALTALSAGMRVKAIELPEGKDPADLISENAKDFAERMKNAKPVVEFFLSVLLSSERDPHRLVLAVERTVLPLLVAIKSPMEREHFILSVARATALSPEAVRESLKRAPRAPESAGTGPAAPATARSEAPTDESRFLAIIASYPDSLLAKRVESEYARIIGQPLPEEEIPEKVLFETGILYGEAPAEDAADEHLRRFEKTALERAYASSLAELRRAESGGDADEIRKAAESCDRLRKAIAALK